MEQHSLILNWKLYNNSLDTELRYCHNCGKKEVFKDSLKRRHNANGKDIFHFAIYKCPKGHTWNKNLGTFKAFAELNTDNESLQVKESEYDQLCLSDLKEQYSAIVINLDTLELKERIDKFIASKLVDKSRNEVIKWIKSGIIKVNHESVKPKTILKEKDQIMICI